MRFKKWIDENHISLAGGFTGAGLVYILMYSDSPWWLALLLAFAIGASIELLYWLFIGRKKPKESSLSEKIYGKKS